MFFAAQIKVHSTPLFWGGGKFLDGTFFYKCSCCIYELKIKEIN